MCVRMHECMHTYICSVCVYIYLFVDYVDSGQELDWEDTDQVQNVQRSPHLPYHPCMVFLYVNYVGAT